MTAINDRLEKIKLYIKEISPADLSALSGHSLIDVRETEETLSGVIAHAVHIPRGQLELKIDGQVQDPERTIVLYCAGGTRSLLAAADLWELGYRKIFSLTGGIKGWKDSGRPLEMKANSGIDLERYNAQIRLPEVGLAGQERLAKARVLIVGAGGLSSPVAYYLAAAGVGTLGLIDDDKVEKSNLQRQILHSTEKLGVAKVESARMTLKNLNPSIQVNAYKLRLSRENVDELVGQYDIVIDGTDNFQTRYLISDACSNHNKPNIHGAIFSFHGQASVFCTPQGPCYRCLFPEPPPAGIAPDCAEAGVLGVLPGLIGLIEATEALKLILGLGTSLLGRLLTYDALEMQFREMQIRKNPDCPACALKREGKKIPYHEIAAQCSI